MAQNKDLVADAQTLLEENLFEKKSVESARRLSSAGIVCYLGNTAANNTAIDFLKSRHDDLLLLRLNSIRPRVFDALGSLGG